MSFGKYEHRKTPVTSAVVNLGSSCKKTELPNTETNKSVKSAKVGDSFLVNTSPGNGMISLLPT